MSCFLYALWHCVLRCFILCLSFIFSFILHPSCILSLFISSFLSLLPLDSFVYSWQKGGEYTGVYTKVFHHFYMTHVHILRRRNSISCTFVDIVFCPPSICKPDPEKSRNIIFSPWGHENIQNSVAWPVQALEHLKCLFKLKWPKCPWSALAFHKLSQNNVFHSFTPNPSFSKIFNKFDQVWLEVNPRGTQKA